MSDSDGGSLTRREFDAVIRRASELASSDPDAEEGTLTEGELFRIAGEVGLSDEHVRTALADVRSSGEGGGLLDRMFGPSSIRVARVVGGQPERLINEIDDFLVGSQILQRVRRSVDLLQYRPAVDWASTLARAASFASHRYYISSAKSVEVRVERVGESRTLVEFRVEPGTRNEDVAGAVLGGGVLGGAVGALSGVALTGAFPVFLAGGLGVVAGGAVWSGVGYTMGKGHKKKVEDVRAEVEGVLDALDMGRSLEPPPASWRRWVKRNFHGVARDFMGADGE